MKKLGTLFTYSDIDTFKESLSKMKESQINHSQIQKMFIENFSFDRGIIVLSNILRNNDFV